MMNRKWGRAMPNSPIGGVFEAAGFQFLDTPILQPADVFLDRSGDAIRRRLFMLTDPGGAEHCLRPELTIPLAREVIASGEISARIWSSGLVFRFGGDGRGEFVQAGLEHLGGAHPSADDAEIFALTSEACKILGSDVPVATPMATLGDLGIFHGILDTADVPDTWRERLRRHFWHADVFQDLLARLKGEAKPLDDENAGLMASIGGLSPEEATRAVHDILKLANIRPVGGRTVEEITARFLEKAQDASNETLAPNVAAAIEAVLALKTMANTAVDELALLAKTHGLNIDAALSNLADRHESLEKAGIDLGKARFAASFGRELEYYTGFVFDLHRGETKIAGGGRYNGLMQQLGASAPMTAVGSAIWVDRASGQMKGAAR